MSKDWRREIRKQSLWRSVQLKTRPWKPRRQFSSVKPTKPLWLGDGDSEQGGRERTSTNVTSRTLQANGNNRRRASWCTDDTRGTLSGTCWPLFPPASPPGPPRPVRMRSGPPPVPRSSKKGKFHEHLLLTLQSKFNYPISKVVFSSLAFNFIRIHLQQLNYRTLIYFFLSQKGSIYRAVWHEDTAWWFSKEVLQARPTLTAGWWLPLSCPRWGKWIWEKPSQLSINRGALCITYGYSGLPSARPYRIA